MKNSAEIAFLEHNWMKILDEDAAETSCSHRFEAYRAIGVTRGCARTNRRPSSFLVFCVVVCVCAPSSVKIKGEAAK